MDKWTTNVSYDDRELGDDMEFSSDSGLIREILLKYSNKNICNNKSGGQTASKDNLLRLISTHFPSKYINPTGKRQNGRRKCVVCRKHKKRTETQFECKDCKVGLCIEPCFKLYHTKENY